MYFRESNRNNIGQLIDNARAQKARNKRALCNVHWNCNREIPDSIYYNFKAGHTKHEYLNEFNYKCFVISYCLLVHNVNQFEIWGIQ